MPFITGDQNLRDSLGCCSETGGTDLSNVAVLLQSNNSTVCCRNTHTHTQRQQVQKMRVNNDTSIHTHNSNNCPTPHNPVTAPTFVFVSVMVTTESQKPFKVYKQEEAEDSFSFFIFPLMTLYLPRNIAYMGGRESHSDSVVVALISK